MLKLFFILNKLFSFLYSLISDKKKKKGIFLNQKETLNELLKTNKSFIRWGDGESKILIGGDLYFQSNSLSLFFEFIKIIKTYSSNSKFLIAMPNIFLNSTKYELLNKQKYKTWKLTRYIYEWYFINKESKILSAFIFRENSELTNQDIFKLWEKEEYIFFIHNNYKYYIDFCKKFSDKTVFFIEVTSANSFNKSNEILVSIINKIKDFSIENDNVCVLISSGPAAKPIVCRLTNMNIRALDTGHYFDYKFYDIKRANK
jgi:hypothetical protein